jgi:hypothetical protein
MGRILPNTRVTDDNVRHYIEQATKDYSTFLNSAPTFCTYFSKDHLKSTYDRSLENIHEAVGADSPVVFNQIDNLPIYEIENASFGTEITDFGVTGNVTSSAIVLPDTVIPSTDDVFVIEYQTDRKVFIVTDVEQDNYNNSKYYKIIFQLSSFNIEDVKKQVDEEYTVDYNLIGKVSDPIVRHSDFELYLTLEAAYDELLSGYNERFYSKDIGLYVDSESDYLRRPVIDRLLNYFVMTNRLNEPYKAYRNFLYVDHSVLEGVRVSEFNKSFYRVVSAYQEPVTDRLLKFSNRRCVLTRCETSRYSQDWFSQTDHYRLEAIADSVTPSPIDEVISPFPEELIASVQHNTPDSLPCLQRLIVRYVNNYYTKDNLYKLPAELETFEEGNNDYHLIPIVLYIIQYYRKVIIGSLNVE